jgi:hypothetical protein
VEGKKKRTDDAARSRNTGMISASSSVMLNSDLTTGIRSIRKDLSKTSPHPQEMIKLFPKFDEV